MNPEYLLTELLYFGLTRLSTDMTPEPDLAERGDRHRHRSFMLVSHEPDRLVVVERQPALLRLGPARSRIDQGR
ncbi:MAG: hypothetical protein EOS54_18730 [Mesorhizobium sp.]|uniref:hypothetical protein n=1 Tax=unclassified Mesorhizobium TaxID=325217 RepID=UPI000FD3B87D|nr:MULTISPECIES: hypothetical protein [unclassified Mesorhizobium]RVD44728.1 hypothetical protein EN742_01305 [Mesorhizobium sp. M4A.F.Ca.ET.020.02.1.1]RWC07923.1 MAG: hypothetical protein EOS53_32485 [Mesorhizobium sp.]RWC26013.1 MAG: hypothetical protein EOS70_32525 [Mesorhizobium sp.]RWC51594.1 MAG: hypothetical protein EOS54_18730 [Mesorhizobium sp.]RWD39748.1 MAG: hypothetical protein EOS35_33605 [Mesorhizobium sp.]